MGTPYAEAWPFAPSEPISSALLLGEHGSPVGRNISDWEGTVSGLRRLWPSEMTFQVPFSLEGVLASWVTNLSSGLQLSGLQLSHCFLLGVWPWANC